MDRHHEALGRLGEGGAGVVYRRRTSAVSRDQGAYAFARKNPDDPRPWPLLGAAYAQADRLSGSVDQCLRAYQVDSTCRADRQMLADLLKAAAHPVASRKATRAIHDIYGAETIPALEQALEHRRGDRYATARLTRLRESLPQ